MFEGAPPQAAQTVKLPHHARTLQLIAETDAEDFYSGDLAARIIADSRAFGGYFCPEDFAQYQVSWVEPISVSYRGYEVCEIPPNGQGIVALMALNILKNFNFDQRENADSFHLQWEAMKLAFADGKRHVTDPACMDLPCGMLLDPAYGRARAKQITQTAAVPAAGMPPKSGTVYLCAADGEGNMVPYIQSNYNGALIGGTEGRTDSNIACY